MIERALLLHQLLDSGYARVFNATAQTSVRQLEYLLGLGFWVVGGRNVDGLSWMDGGLVSTSVRRGGDGTDILCPGSRSGR